MNTEPTPPPQHHQPAEPAGPVFPLTREQFAHALAAGLGRARLHVDRCGAAGMEDLILEACLHNRAYDRQCEGDRSDWLDQLVVAAGLEQQVLAALADSLSHSVEGEWWDTELQCRLARCLAARGHGAARDMLHAAYRLSPDPAESIGGREIVELDGAAGLLFVAGVLGEALAANPALDVDKTPLTIYDDRHGAGQARVILEEAAAAHPVIRPYLDRVDQLKPSRIRQREIPSFTEIIHSLGLPGPRITRMRFGRWGREAKDEELRIVANILTAASDPVTIRNSLGCFVQRAYPPVRRRLIELAEHADGEVRRAALAALARHEHTEVRSLALCHLATGRFAEGEPRLLERNYRSGDEELLARVLGMVAYPDTMHAAAGDVLAVLKANPSPGVRLPALIIYEHGPCSLCRGDAVQLLVRADQAPAWLLQEGRFDADAETRALCGAAIA